MDRRAAACMMIAGIILYGGDGCAIRSAEEAVKAYIDAVRPTATLRDTVARIRARREQGQTPRPEESDGQRLAAPGIITDTIESVQWNYATDHARELTHKSLELISKDVEWTDDASWRCQIVSHVQGVFYSSAFGIADPQKTSKWGDPIMDEERAERIHSHCLRYHGRGGYTEGDICLRRFAQEMRQERERQRRGRPTWGDLAVKYLGARPASECRPLSPQQRAIGRYWGR